MSGYMGAPDGWAAGVIDVQYENNKSPVVGWVKAPFGIDFRFTEDDLGNTAAVWVITHMASGKAVGAWMGTAVSVMQIADRLAEIGNWDFTSASEMKMTMSDAKVAWEHHKHGERIGAAGTFFGVFQ